MRLTLWRRQSNGAGDRKRQRWRWRGVVLRRRSGDAGAGSCQHTSRGGVHGQARLARRSEEGWGREDKRREEADGVGGDGLLVS